MQERRAFGLLYAAKQLSCCPLLCPHNCTTLAMVKRLHHAGSASVCLFVLIVQLSTATPCRSMDVRRTEIEILPANALFLAKYLRIPQDLLSTIMSPQASLVLFLGSIQTLRRWAISLCKAWVMGQQKARRRYLQA